MVARKKTLEVWPPLSKDEAEALRRQLRDNFATGYLTMVSIVLGVALAVVADQTFGKDGVFALNPGEAFDLSLRATLVFLIICGTFHYYYFFVSFVKVMPFFEQTFIPFLLGGALVVLAKMIADPTGEKYFWAVAAVVWFIGALAFANSVRVAGQKYEYAEVSAPMRDEFIKETIHRGIWFFGIGVTTGLLWALHFWPQLTQGSLSDWAWHCFDNGFDRWVFGVNLTGLTMSTWATRQEFLKPTYGRIAKALGLIPATGGTPSAPATGTSVIAQKSEGVSSAAGASKGGESAIDESRKTD